MKIKRPKQKLYDFLVCLTLALFSFCIVAFLSKYIFVSIFVRKNVMFLLSPMAVDCAFWPDCVDVF